MTHSPISAKSPDTVAITTVLGVANVTSLSTGICALRFDDAATLATATPAQRCIPFDTHALQQAIAHPWESHEITLDAIGTPFQRAVWAALCSTAPGTTLTYSELAVRVGRPKAVRAVASACASNNIAVLIPCHRVIRSDGTLGGYRWGLHRKAALLAAERDRCPIGA